jgi:two-component system nitrate/nitrite response regulator NarL
LPHEAQPTNLAVMTLLGDAPMANLSGDPARRIRVELADHHPIYRAGLARCVRECDDIELVAETSDGVTTLARLREHRPDAAVVTRDLPGHDAASIAATARREGLPTRVVVLADAVDGPGVHAALRAGAAAYLTKDSSAADVTDALRAVAAGDVVLTSPAMTSLGREIRLRHRSDRPWLTHRERQILVLVADDSTTPQIASLLHLSVATVKSHVHGAYQKLGVSDRGSAVAVAMRLGLIE